VTTLARMPASSSHSTSLGKGEGWLQQDVNIIVM